MTFTWEDSFGAVTGVNPTVTLGLGLHTITLTVDDGNGGTATDIVYVTVADETAPKVHLSDPICVPVGKKDTANFLKISATDNCEVVGLSIDKVEIVDKKGKIKKGKFEVEGYDIYVFKAKKGQSVCVTATAVDSSDNSTTVRLCKPLLQCKKPKKPKKK